ncbi:phosphatase [Grimontia sp. NTOU-MAR1]|uniref:phosphatase n=1 Tax=Grimontia sp. NTOU-MAR1 TaxID=3111011 RepID=UPI002DB8CD90|nr:phosphatase [Grimontia sp. NTOU-MAR1]WRW00727.1 phosphatase [Grimontia sp. NTOU-MAR1]
MKLVVDTHTHTVASGHAYSTILENAAQAKSVGLSHLCVTDHASTMPGAPHHWHFVNQRVIPDLLSSVRIIRGVETNIMNTDGELDMPTYVYAGMEWVNASLHEAVFRALSKEEHTQAMIGAIESQLIDAIAHPGNPNYPIDAEAVVASAVKHGVAIELNNSSLNGSRKGSEPYCLAIAELARDMGAYVTTGSDAHFASDIGNLSSVLTMIEKVGLSEEQVITSGAVRFETFQRRRFAIRQRRVEELAQ